MRKRYLVSSSMRTRYLYYLILLYMSPHIYSIYMYIYIYEACRVSLKYLVEYMTIYVFLCTIYVFLCMLYMCTIYVFLCIYIYEACRVSLTYMCPHTTCPHTICAHIYMHVYTIYVRGHI